MTERVTNTELARLLDLSHVQIHRMRNGSRGTTVETMVKIERVLGWGVADQVRARMAGKYSEQFEAAIERYASDRDTTAGPEERSPTPQ